MADVQLTLRINADGTATVVNDLSRVDKQIDEVGKSAHTASGGMASLTGTVTKLAAGLGGLFVAREIASAFIQTNREAGVLRSQLETVTGSVYAASDAFDALVGFASETPYAVNQSVEAFVKMRALGLDPTERALRSFGDTSAAMGRDLMQFIEAVADASTFEFERLKEFGIKARQDSDSVAFTFRGNTEKIGKDAASIVEYLTKIGETDFVGSMDRQMSTLEGKFSNAGDAADSFFRQLGDEGATDAVIFSLEGVVGTLDAMTFALIGTGDVMAAQFNLWGEAVDAMLDHMERGFNDLGYLVERGLSSLDSSAGDALGSAFGDGFTDGFINALTDFPANLKGVVAIMVGEIVIFKETAGAQIDLFVNRSEVAWEDTKRFFEVAWEGIRIYAGGVIDDLIGYLADFVSAAAENLAALNTAADWAIPDAAIESLRSGADALRGMASAEEEARAAAKASAEEHAERISILDAEADAIRRNTAAMSDAVRTAVAEQLEQVEAEKAIAEVERENAQIYRDSARAKRENAESLDEVIARYNLNRDAAEKDAAATDKDAKAAAKAAKEKEKLAASILAVTSSLDPAVAAMADYAEQVEIINHAYAEGLIASQEEYNRLLSLAATEFQKNAAEASAWGDLMTNTIERLDDSFVDMWEGFIEGGDNAFDALLDMGRKWLAQMIHMFTTQPIVASFGGAFGMPTGGASLVGGSGGAGGGFGNFSLLNPQWWGSNSIGSSISAFGDVFSPGLFEGAGMVPNWQFGIAGGLGALGGGLLADAIWDGQGYSSTGGSLGGAGGAMLGMAFGPAGAILGGLLGSLGGGFLGSLFGDKTDPRIQLSSASQQYPADFEDRFSIASPFGFVGFGGASHGMNASDPEFKGMLETVVALDEMIARLMSPEEVDAATKAVNGLLGTLKDLEGYDDSDAAFQIKERLQVITDVMTSTAGQALDAWVDMFDGTVDDLVAGVATMVDSLLILDSFITLDFGQSITDIRAELEKGTMARLDDMVSGISELAEALDGSEESWSELSLSVSAFSDAAAAAVLAIDQMIAAIDQSFGDFAEQIKLDLLGSDEERYDYLKAQADDLAASLEGMTDPEEIARTVAEIEALSRQAYSLLDESQVDEMGQDFIDFLDGVAAQSTDLLEASQAGIGDIVTNTQDLVSDAMDQAARTMQEAANAQQDAADTMQQAANDFSDAFNANIDGGANDSPYIDPWGNPSPIPYNGVFG